MRAKYGCLGHTMHRDADKPNDLTLSLNYESRERTDELMRDPSLAEAMQRGGVELPRRADKPAYAVCARADVRHLQPGVTAVTATDTFGS